MKVHYTSRGLGDTIDKVTSATGIKSLVHKISSAVGVEDCGCEERRNALNNLVPYTKKEEDVQSGTTSH